MGKDSMIEKLEEVLDYLETDDYDDTCEYHIAMIKNIKDCIRELESEVK